MTGLATLLSRRGEPSRRARRFIVIAAFAVIPLAVATPWLIPDLDWPMPIGLLAFLGVLVALCLPLLALQDFRRNVMRRRLADERERQRRDEAYRISYRIVEIGVVAGLLAAAFLRDQNAAIIAIDLFLIAWPLYVYLIFLPYAVFAWREPDAIDGEAD